MVTENDHPLSVFRQISVFLHRIPDVEHEMTAFPNGKASPKNIPKRPGEHILILSKAQFLPKHLENSFGGFI